MRVGEARLEQLQADPESMTEVERVLLQLDVVDEVKALREQLGAAIEHDVAAIARREVASLCGLVLRRLQDVPRSDHDPVLAALREVFGEALQERGGE